MTELETMQRAKLYMEPVRIGILAETRQGQYGECLAVFYTMEAQRFLLDNLPGILEKG